MDFSDYLDSVSDALDSAGVSVANASDYLLDLAADYSAALAACPYFPGRASEAREDLATALEVTPGARPARFRALTRSLGRRLLPRPSEAFDVDALAIYEPNGTGELVFAGFER